MKFNYDKLLGRIVEIYGNQSNFAKDMKLSERSISIELLKIPVNKVHLYFFNE